MNNSSCLLQKDQISTPLKYSRPFHVLYDRAGRWVGIEDEMSRDGYNYQVITGEEYEERLELPEYTDDQECQFYNVLWVQRGENNVAYRAGCGLVLVEAWEKSNQENTRIILGQREISLYTYIHRIAPIN